MLKRAESHYCEVNTLGFLACNFSMFLRFLKGVHFRKSLTQSERRDRFWSDKFLKIVEHVSYLIKYCKISLLLYSGSSSLLNVRHFFFTHPVALQMDVLLYFGNKVNHRYRNKVAAI